MDRKLIEQAIQKAIKAGAVSAPAIPGTPLNSDLNFVRGQVDVGIEPAAFDNYLAELKRDPEMAQFDCTFATIPTGGGVSSDLKSIGRLLLARAIASGDVTGTVETFCSYVENNKAPVLAVMAVSGVKTSTEVKLGPDIKLVPILSLPPSMQRGAALGQDHFSTFALRSPISSALITELNFGPVFYRLNQAGTPSAEAQRNVSAALHYLDEARTLFSLLGIKTAFTMFWVQPKDLLMSAGITAGWNSSIQTFHGQETAIDAKAAEALAAAYFRIDQARRHRTLRIPLDRLDRAAHDYDFADRSIDLGIALEALLLHDLDNQERGELKFRLSLRGAWLVGRDEPERTEIRKALAKMYDLRSRAVHSGSVDQSEESRDTIQRGTELCKQLIQKAIDADCLIDWNKLVLGGAR
ncbi:MAG: hypothetical protein ACLPKB_35295 [Xanthobacteraceae bacterium]